jgi:hypothetical protein
VVIFHFWKVPFLHDQAPLVVNLDCCEVQPKKTPNTPANKIISSLGTSSIQNWVRNFYHSIYF